MNIRPSRSDDISALKAVLDETQLFPSEMLPDMMNGFLSDQASEDIWLTCEINNQVVGFCYAVPEALTEGTWNLLAIAIKPSEQREGIGSALVAELEKLLRQRGHRILIVDTSGMDEFANARRFYARNSFTEEARIRDFWAAGDDKIVFWKAL